MDVLSDIISLLRASTEYNQTDYTPSPRRPLARLWTQPLANRLISSNGFCLEHALFVLKEPVLVFNQIKLQILGNYSWSYASEINQFQSDVWNGFVDLWTKCLYSHANFSVSLRCHYYYLSSNIDQTARQIQGELESLAYNLGLIYGKSELTDEFDSPWLAYLATLNNNLQSYHNPFKVKSVDMSTDFRLIAFIQGVSDIKSGLVDINGHLIGLSTIKSGQVAAPPENSINPITSYNMPQIPIDEQQIREVIMNSREYNSFSSYLPNNINWPYPQMIRQNNLFSAGEKNPSIPPVADLSTLKLENDVLTQSLHAKHITSLYRSLDCALCFLKKDLDNDVDNENKNRALQELYSNRVIIPSGCWIWSGGINDKGYGTVSVEGIRWRVHRLSYYLHNSDFDDQLTIDHLCYNEACFNPEHLEQVTLAENVLRAIEHRTGIFDRCENNHVMTEANTDLHNGSCIKCRVAAKREGQRKNREKFTE